MEPWTVPEDICLRAQFFASDPVVFGINVFFLIVFTNGVIACMKLFHWQRKNGSRFHPNAEVLFWNHHLALLLASIFGLSSLVCNIWLTLSASAANEPCSYATTIRTCLFYDLGNSLRSAALLAVPFCGAERIVATVLHKTYETQTGRWLGIGLVALQWMASVGWNLMSFMNKFHQQLQTNEYDNSSSVQYSELLVASCHAFSNDLMKPVPTTGAAMMAVLALFRIITFSVFGWVYYTNTRWRKIRLHLELSAKYQISENVRAGRIHLPMFVLSLLLSVFTIILVVTAKQGDWSPVVKLRMLLFATYLTGLYVVLMPALAVTGLLTKLMAYKAPTAPLAANNQVLPINNSLIPTEQRMHFQLLTEAWA